MASKRDFDEEVVIQFRGEVTRIPIHWRTAASFAKRAGRKVEGYYDYVSGHIWVSHEANKKKVLDHELEHALVEFRQRVWDGINKGGGKR